MQDGASAHNLEMTCDASKDLDGHLVMHVHDFNFWRGQMSFVIWADFSYLEEAAWLNFNLHNDQELQCTR